MTITDTESGTMRQLRASCDSLLAELEELGACGCSEDEGPCERHSVVVASFNGASSRTADELCAVVVDELCAMECARRDPAAHAAHDSDACAAVVLSADDAEWRDRVWRELWATERGGMSAWLENPEDADALRDMVDRVESDYTPADHVGTWDDGWTLYRITGGPLSEDAPEGIGGWIEDGALDVYASAELRAGSDPIVGDVVIVVTVGGPHIEAEISVSGALTVRGFWGSDRYTRHGTASPELASWCDEFAELCRPSGGAR